jgi:hypothetical protein
MKMKSQRKIERDRVKREAARKRVRPATQSETVEAAEGADESLDDVDLEVARSVLGYDE